MSIIDNERCCAVPSGYYGQGTKTQLAGHSVYNVARTRLFVEGNKEEMFLSSSTTMDIGIIRDLFPHCIEAGKILNIDFGIREKIRRSTCKNSFLIRWERQPSPGLD